MSLFITISNLSALDSFLLNRSCMQGFAPTQADVTALEFVGGTPDSINYPNISRWYSYITSFSAEERAAWPNPKFVISGNAPTAVASSSAAASGGDDDDFDLFGDDDDAGKESLAAKRAAAAAAKKAQPTGTKSSILLEVKVWEAETSLDELEAKIRTLTIEGVHWGATKKVPVGYGIFKLQVLVTVIDDLVPSSEDLTDPIEELEEVQSVDIAAWNKI